MSVHVAAPMQAGLPCCHMFTEQVMKFQRNTGMYKQNVDLFSS